MAYSNSVLSPYEILPLPPPPHLPHPKKQIPREIFLFYHENVCCMYSSESPHRGNSNEYIQHTIIVKEIKKTLNYRYLLPDLAP